LRGFVTDDVEILRTDLHHGENLFLDIANLSMVFGW